MNLRILDLSMSNLRFISKIIEKCVAKQPTEYLKSSGLCETFQFAYKSNHSTETALIRVFNDIALTIEQHNSIILILLDILAAFDTVDHNILVTRLLNSFGISGTALERFQSYLFNCTQFVRVDGSNSTSHDLSLGVPQGSVPGPLLYSLYGTLLGKVARCHEIFHHCYADDTQLYIAFKTSSVCDINPKLSCVRNIDASMLSNKLK